MYTKENFYADRPPGVKQIKNKHTRQKGQTNLIFQSADFFFNFQGRSIGKKAKKKKVLQ